MSAIAGITPAGLQRILDAGVAHGILEPTSTLDRLVPKPEYLEFGGGAYARRDVTWSSASVDHATTVGFVVHDVEPQPDLYEDDPESDFDGEKSGYLPHDGVVMCDSLCGALEHPPADDPAALLATLRHYRDHSVAGGCSHGS